MAEVTLQIYDISQGMAKVLSPMFIGKQIDGIWHTSLVVFGKEYYFGGGICCDVPLTTPFGMPVQRISMGFTRKTQEDLMKFFSCVSHRFTVDSYHIVDHNCNNFTDEALRFLLDKKIPEHISGLPKELLNTPIGQQFAPMIDSMMNMKNTMFPATAATDAFADYVSHEVFFPEMKKIDSYPGFDEFVKNGGLVVYWDPRVDECSELIELVGGIKCRVGFCDVLRSFFLAPEQKIPHFRAYAIGGDLLCEYDFETFKNSVEEINELMNIS